MTNDERTCRLATYIGSLVGLEAHIGPRASYSHMGAVIADTVLQAGMSYRAVVAPRVERLVRRFPDDSTTSRFAQLIETVGPHELLRWKDDEKPRRLVGLTAFLVSEAVETCADLRVWLTHVGNRIRLLSIRGVGPKTADYIGTLVGLSTVAVDRHIIAFVAAAGLRPRDYQDTRQLVLDVARTLGLDAGDLDHAIWSYMESRRGSKRSDASPR